MEHSLFLRQYKIEILRSASQPALLAFFDFESGDFQLEGDGQFIQSNNHIKKSRLNDKNTSLLIQANMKPEIPKGPNDNLNNELLLFLKGSFYNGRQLHRCSGLLRLNRSYKDNKAQWTIYCNLVDNDLDFFEIKFSLPVFASLVNTAGSN